MVLSVFGTLLLSVPALSLLSLEILSFHFKICILICLLLGVTLLRSTGKQDPNIFIGSGENEPALFSQELILQKKGGKGNGYFLDSSNGFASIHDFNYVPGKTILFRQLLAEKKNVITPYCVDDEKRQIVFVETSSGFDPADNGIYFQSQRDHAIKLYVVPYEEYHSTIASLDQKLTSTKNLLLLYGTSRCGTTLFNKCLTNLTTMQSISEPDIFTSLANMASESFRTRDAEIVALARSSAKLLCYLHRNRYPERRDICFAFRFQVVYIADLIQKAIPDSKTVFIYRNALDIIEEYLKSWFIDNNFAYQFIRFCGLDIVYIYYFSNLLDHMWKLMPLMKDTRRFPVSSYQGLGCISPYLMAWLSVMHKAIESHKSGNISILIRYDDLVKWQEALVWKALKIDFPSSVSDVLIPDLSIGQRRCVPKQDAYSYLSDQDVYDIKRFVALHEIGTPDYIIPCTLCLN